MSTMMSRAQRRIANKHMAREATKYPDHLVQIPKDEWPESKSQGTRPIEAWRSRDYLVQVYLEPLPCAARLSILRTSLDSSGGWKQDIPWTELQRLKSECGFKDEWAVEIYPPDSKIVNVASIRHIFVVPVELVPFAWGAQSS